MKSKMFLYKSKVRFKGYLCKEKNLEVGYVRN